MNDERKTTKPNISPHKCSHDWTSARQCRVCSKSEVLDYEASAHRSAHISIQKRIDDIEDWIGGNVGHANNEYGQVSANYDAMSLTRLLRKHLEETQDDGYNAGWGDAEIDFQKRPMWPTPDENGSF